MLKPETMEEHLIGYLRNELDPASQRAVEAYLRSHPEAAARVEQLRQTLAPWDEDADLVAPPSDLVRRTLARLAEHRARPLPRAPRPRSYEVGGLTSRRFRLADMAMAAAVLLLVGAVALAWIPRIRLRANELACQNQMRAVWQALENYSEQPANHGEFPRVEANGPHSVAGIFVPMLQDAGLLTSDVSLVCSGTNPRGDSRPSLQDLDQLYREQPDTFKSLTHTLGGTYAYTLGYSGNGELHGLRRDSGDLLPLLADAPPESGTGLSPNHGGSGQNVLYIGGNVRWCTQRTVGVNCDDIYLNQDGKLGTGRKWNDTVLGPSYATPYGVGE